MTKDTCIICKRKNVRCIAYAGDLEKMCCPRDFKLMNKFAGDVKLAREERAKKPLKGASAEREIGLTAVTVTAKEQSQKISIAFDVDVRISNVRIIGNWKAPGEKEEGYEYKSEIDDTRRD